MAEDTDLSKVQRRGRQIVDTVEATLRADGVEADVMESSLSLLRDQVEGLVGEARKEGEGHGKRLRDWELNRLVRLELALYVTPDGAWEDSLGGYFSESFDSSRDALQDALARWRGDAE
jgi:hypothetical protein